MNSENGSCCLPASTMWPSKDSSSRKRMGIGPDERFSCRVARFVCGDPRGESCASAQHLSLFMPLLHLDAEHDLVQSIKLAEQIMGGLGARTPAALPLPVPDALRHRYGGARPADRPAID